MDGLDTYFTVYTCKNSIGKNLKKRVLSVHPSKTGSPCLQAWGCLLGVLGLEFVAALCDKLQHVGASQDNLVTRLGSAHKLL